MAMVVWVMMGIAVWHFTVFLPDRFWGGIVGAFGAGGPLVGRSSASSRTGSPCPARTTPTSCRR